METREMIYDVMDACLLAGKIMLQSGAETYRVEDTMTRIASSLGVELTHSYVTPTGIVFSVEGTRPAMTRLIRISNRTTDLKKVMQVNDVSRRISGGSIGLEEACSQLREIERSSETYGIWTQIMAAALASGCFTIMFLGGWPDFLPSLIAGGAGYYFVAFFHRLIPVKFFAEFVGAVVVCVVSLGFISFGLGNELDKIIIGAVMPLVPGLLITNAVRDLMAGHLVSGLSKGAEAFLTAFAIGSGVAVVLSLL
ncbi:threonine/serine exporter family protein [Mesobacillus foraminis]|jgi:uncharacterized membrane protein YjjP (DUF1212 family)|uniref:Uncharacterized membrane protein YjjP (DUF1212 family) n=1 Tax=Mesobacillus foraminis TaxID=279826 RepID=A0A4R2B6W1_9BACI|nr:threonine/serine exporter family protein [Mesobacillus foraminis]TCN22431.1 uncharacterized membrane protein YjjP (DUF1212 family) [Mesobacillus foraminis]